VSDTEKLSHHSKLENFKIIHVNVQSISNELESLELFLKVEKPDIFCLRERHFHLLETRLNHIPGYELGCIYARYLKKSGVAIFVKSGLAFKEMDVSKYKKLIVRWRLSSYRN